VTISTPVFFRSAGGGEGLFLSLPVHQGSLPASRSFFSVTAREEQWRRFLFPFSLWSQSGILQAFDDPSLFFLFSRCLQTFSLRPERTGPRDVYLFLFFSFSPRWMANKECPRPVAPFPFFFGTLVAVVLREGQIFSFSLPLGS